MQDCLEQLTITPFLKEIANAANFLGHETYIVGGFVRDLLIAQNHNATTNDQHDLDLVINTNAIDFVHQFQKYYEDNHPQHLSFEIIEEHKQFGTIKIKHPEYEGFKIEMASTRKEEYESPAAYPKIQIINDIEEDLIRRDFTINALLLSLNKKTFGEIIDHVGALNDLEKKQIKVFHDQSFKDDPTRIIRAIRFAAQFDFNLEPKTRELLLKARQDQQFEQWQSERHKTFKIEREKLKGLNNEAQKRAIDLLIEFNLPSI
jgi:tRNA nucleotidyltransferase (CCA-adding enzyme)